jgi:hypothetical protein
MKFFPEKLVTEGKNLVHVTLSCCVKKIKFSTFSVDKYKGKPVSVSYRLFGMFVMMISAS